MYIVGKLWKQWIDQTGQSYETWVACELYNGILWMIHNNRPHKEFETVGDAETWIGNSVKKCPEAEYQIFNMKEFDVLTESSYIIIKKLIQEVPLKQEQFDWGIPDRLEFIDPDDPDVPF